jgi:aspartate racemase
VSSAEADPAARRLGIVGGMGPLAGAEFFRRFTAAYPATRDQEHPVVHLLSDPTVDSRSDAVLTGHGRAGEAIRHNLETLIALGVDVVAVPCNTAHHFIDQFRDTLFRDGVELAHIVDATLDRLQATGGREAWLLGTGGTIRSGGYARRATERGLLVHVPDPLLQREVTACIDLVKRGDLAAAARTAADVSRRLVAAAELPIIAACTELPLAFEAIGDAGPRYLSSIDALVDRTIELVTPARGD